MTRAPFTDGPGQLPLALTLELLQPHEHGVVRDVQQLLVVHADRIDACPQCRIEPPTQALDIWAGPRHLART